VIRPESPLLALPRNLDTKQRFLLDTVRVQAQWVDIAYRRLVGNLTSASPNGVAAMLDAWTIVDAIRRLRRVVLQLPRYHGRAPSKQVFLRTTAGVEDPRNLLHHLESEAGMLIESSYPPLGALSWFTPEGEGKRFTATLFIAGRFEGAAPRATMRVPEASCAGTHQIELWTAGLSVDVGSLHGAVKSLVTAWEGMLRRKFPGVPTAASDASITVYMERSPRLRATRRPG